MKLLIVMLTMSLLLPSCSRTKDPEPVTVSDRRLVLQSIGQNQIITSLLLVDESVNGLREYVNAFAFSPENKEKLLTLRLKWVEMAVSWKRVSMFTFGPMTENLVKSSIYGPVDEEGIGSIIANKNLVIDNDYISSLG